MDARAFGKLDLSSPPQLRPFEVYFNIIAREGAEAWKSSYVSVQNLLSHLGRYTMSYSSREKYLTLLHRFCRRTNLSPDQLARLPREKAEALIQNFADELAACGRSKSYVNTVIKRLRSFYRVNGYRGNRELVIASVCSSTLPKKT